MSLVPRTARSFASAPRGGVHSREARRRSVRPAAGTRRGHSSSPGSHSGSHGPRREGLGPPPAPVRLGDPTPYPAPPPSVGAGPPHPVTGVFISLLLRRDSNTTRRGPEPSPAAGPPAGQPPSGQEAHADPQHPAVTHGPARAAQAHGASLWTPRGKPLCGASLGAPGASAHESVPLVPVEQSQGPAGPASRPGPGLPAGRRVRGLAGGTPCSLPSTWPGASLKGDRSDAATSPNQQRGQSKGKNHV